MRRALVIAFVGTTLVGSAGATATELPQGWWKGTIVLEEHWDRLEDTALRPGSYKGSATLRIRRTATDRATYELEYLHEEYYGAPGPGDDDCRGKLRTRWTSTLRKTGPIGVVVSDLPSGASFYVDTRLSASIAGTQYTCGAPEERYDAGELGANFAFLSRGPDGATRRRGTDTNDIPVFFPNDSKPRTGGVNTSRVTFDLRLVRSAKTTGPARAGTPVLTRLTPSAIRAAVRVSQGGKPVRADSARCVTRLPLASEKSGYRESGGQPEISIGEVACPHVFNNTRFKGKRLSGEMTLRVGKTTTTKRYSVVIGPGKTLHSPRGAVIAKS